MQHQMHSSRAAATTTLGVIALSILSVIAAGMVLTVYAPAADAQSSSPGSKSCRGKAATIVGHSRVVRGTPRNDVIVTNGAAFVTGLGGDDLICVTLLREVEDVVHVDSGTGDDRVFVAGTVRRGVWATLGEGDDRFVGGAGNDEVVTGAFEVLREGGFPDTGRDRVSTGSGNDHVVTAGAAGSKDLIDLGRGDDGVELRTGAMADGGRVIGGPGSDRLAIPVVSGSAVLDTTTGVGTNDGQPWVRFAQVENFTVTPRDGLTFIGNGADQVLQTAASLVADMGGGDDVIMTSVGSGGAIAGGAGRDRLELSQRVGDVTVDLAAETMSTGFSPGTVGVRGFEDVSVDTEGAVTLRGSNVSEKLSGSGCSILLQGLGGNDRLLALRRPSASDGPPPCSHGPAQISGGDGDDVIVGGTRNDTLVGDDGTDAIDGLGGTDACDGEIVARCETSPS